MPSRTNRRHEMTEGTARQLAPMQDAAAHARNIFDDAIQYLRDYSREKPESAAMWCLGIGFVLGWKLKPW